MNYKIFLTVTLLVSPFSALADDKDSANSNRLVTPTLWAQAPTYFACNITNIGKRTRDVTTRIIEGTNGRELLNKTMKLAPQRTMDTTVAGLEAPGGPLYCDFKVRGPKKQFRGVAKLWRGPSAENSSDITAISAE
jgi:hypothetical protein